MSDEPVFTGWLQTQLSGDIARARDLQHEGRRFLGKLLTLHGVPTRQAAGEPTGFFRATRLLPDGSRLTAWHNNGHNVLRIDGGPRSSSAPTRTSEALELPREEVSSPAPRAHHLPAPETPEPPLLKTPERDVPRPGEGWEDETEDIRLCGWSGDSPWVWAPGEDTVTLLPLYPGCTFGEALAISGDGALVVGSCGNTAGAQYAVLWRDSGSGWEPEALDSPGRAVSISQDGSVVGGQNFNATAYVPFGVTDQDIPPRQWVWTRATGVMLLADSHMPSNESGAVVSGNGQWAAGNRHRVDPNYEFFAPSNDNHPIPYVGWFVEVGTADQPFFQLSNSRLATWQRGQDGTLFAGPAEHYDAFDFTEHSDVLFPAYDDQTFSYPNQFSGTVYGIADDGTFVGLLDGEFGFVCTDGQFTYYTQPIRDQHESMAIGGEFDTHVPHCISADATRIAGVTFPASGDTDQAWVRIQGTRYALGDGGVNAMTADGLLLAGYSGERAVYWDADSGKRHAIPTTGQATGIGRTQQRRWFDADGNVEREETSPPLPYF